MTPEQDHTVVAAVYDLVAAAVEDIEGEPTGRWADLPLDAQATFATGLTLTVQTIARTAHTYLPTTNESGSTEGTP
jgi:hypothetical protein